MLEILLHKQLWNDNYNVLSHENIILINGSAGVTDICSRTVTMMI